MWPPELGSLAADGLTLFLGTRRRGVAQKEAGVCGGGETRTERCLRAEACDSGGTRVQS